MRSGAMSAIHARKRVCPKCGGPYAVRRVASKAKRYCKPCYNAWARSAYGRRVHLGQHLLQPAQDALVGRIEPEVVGDPVE